MYSHQELHRLSTFNITMLFKIQSIEMTAHTALLNVISLHIAYLIWS